MGSNWEEIGWRKNKDRDTGRLVVGMAVFPILEQSRFAVVERMYWKGEVVGHKTKTCLVADRVLMV